MVEKPEENRMADDQITLDINRMLDNLASTPSNHSIYRVCDRLRSLNDEAHDPKIIAIGPLHHGKPRLQSMEHHKMQYLKSLRSSRDKSSMNTYVAAIRNMEEEAWKFYKPPITLVQDEFLRMLLLDGIFIVEFLRKYDKVFDTDQEVDKDRDDDVVFQFESTLLRVLHDLMLFENQIPLFVIKELFVLSRINDQENFVKLIWPLIDSRETQAGPKEYLVSESLQGYEAPHLLGLVHYAKCLPLINDIPPSTNKDININSATELQEAGIIFKTPTHSGNSAKGNSFLNISFKNRTMKIPTLVISDETETWFRNMIAYEDDFPWRNKKYITDYIFIMHCLIQSPRDVKLLRRRGIISSWTGGDETVYHFIKKLENELHISENFSYAHVISGANNHCSRSWNKWMAILRQNYFDSPWKYVSFLAAVVLLLLTGAQTMFAVLSYGYDMKKGS